MTNFKSVWCDINLPADLKAGSRIVSTFINGKDENGYYTWAEVSSFIGSADQAGVQASVDSLIAQSGDEHHVFIEDLELRADGSFEVCLGS
tara:strand:- start:692 stop:964 length:273 start_codon:yes stop_codon:yes gene_type:complete